MVWAKLSTTTLASANSTISSGTITTSKFIFELTNEIDPSNSNEGRRERFNSDSGTNYARRQTLNGASDTTTTSDTEISNGITTATPALFVEYIVNISTEEKLVMGWFVEQNSAGAGTAPTRREFVNKWANTSSQITQIDKSFATNTYASGSNLSVLGSDGTITATLQDGVIFEESDTNKSYIWSSSTNSWTQL